jgi:GT2 family glycosyltransferase
MDRQLRHNLFSGDIYPSMIPHNLIGAPSRVLVRTEALRLVGGFDESPALIFCEDYDLWLTLARKSPIAVTMEVVPKYRVHPGQATANWTRHLEAHLQVLEKHRRTAFPEHLPLFQKAIAQLHLSYGDHLYVCGSHSQARSHWKMAASHDLGLGRWRLLFRYGKSYVPPKVMAAARGIRRYFRSGLGVANPCRPAHCPRSRTHEEGV